jgi:hypothetical protein
MIAFLISGFLAMLPLPYYDFATVTNVVATPTLSPTPGDRQGVVPCSSYCITITFTCATTGSHIFYTLDGTAPTHNGDIATGTTTRIGSNSGTYTHCIGADQDANQDVVAIGYLAGSADSGFATGLYTETCSSGR